MALINAMRIPFTLPSEGNTLVLCTNEERQLALEANFHILLVDACTGATPSTARVVGKLSSVDAAMLHSRPSNGSEEFVVYPLTAMDIAYTKVLNLTLHDNCRVDLTAPQIPQLPTIYPEMPAPQLLTVQLPALPSSEPEVAQLPPLYQAPHVPQVPSLPRVSHLPLLPLSTGLNSAQVYVKQVLDDVVSRYFRMGADVEFTTDEYLDLIMGAIKKRRAQD